MLWGYARDTDDEQAHAQVAELQVAEDRPETVVVDRSASDRPGDSGLERLLTEIEPGDVVMVTDLRVLGPGLPTLVHVGSRLARCDAHLRVLRPAVDTRAESHGLLTTFGLLANLQRATDDRTVRSAVPAPAGAVRRRGRPRRLTDEQIVEARTMYEGGTSAKDVAEHFGIPRSTVYRTLRP